MKCLAPTLALLALSSTAQAATMTAVADAGRTGSSNREQCYNTGSTAPDAGCEITATTNNADHSETRADTFATAYAGVNSVTGSLTGGVSVSATQATPEAFLYQDGYVSFWASLGDRVTASGEGTVTATFTYSVIVDLNFYDTVLMETAYASLTGYLSIGHPGVQQDDSVSVEDGGLGDGNGTIVNAAKTVITRTLTQTISVYDGYWFDATASVAGGLNDFGSMDIDYAYLTLTASGGVTLTPSDAAFLSAPATVPLPAGVWLMGTGLCAMALLRRR